jgi:Putative MetA-pathway of phenol degradation
MQHRGILLGLAVLLLGVTPALAEDRPWLSLSTSANYSVGDYGTGKDTTIVYAPFTLGVSPIDRLWLSATVPFIHQTTQNVVLTGGGVVSRKNQKGKLAQPSSSTTEDGLGDVLFKASFVVLQEAPLVPEVAPYAKIKFPTADQDRGLGTGEFDETFGVDVSKNIIGDLFGYLGLAYTFIGDPPGSDLRDSFGWSVGAAYAVIRPLSVFAFLDGATAVSPGQEDPLEVRVGAELRLTKVLKLTGAVTRGLSNGSADWGAPPVSPFAFDGDRLSSRADGGPAGRDGRRARHARAETIGEEP